MDTVENETPLVNHRGFKDCLPLIFSFLSPLDQFTFRQVCREWKEVAERCLKKLDLTDPSISESWKAVAKRCSKKADISDASSSQLTATDLKHILQTYPNINSVRIIHHPFEPESDLIVTVAENCPHLIEFSVCMSTARDQSSPLSLGPLMGLVLDWNIGFSVVDDEILSLVKACENLETFSVGIRPPYAYKLRPEIWLEHLHSPLRSLKLKYLDLKPQSLLTSISQCKGTLNKLALDGCDGLTITDIEAVAAMCPQLIGFDFSEVNRGLCPGPLLFSIITQPILRWSRLQELRLGGYGFDDEFVAKLIVTCPQLEKIDFWDSDFSGPQSAKKVTAVGMAKLSSLPRITSLKLDSHRELIVDRVLTAFERMNNLEYLELGLGHFCVVYVNGWRDILDKCPRLQRFGMKRYIDVGTIKAACRIMDTLPDRRQLTIVISNECYSKPEIKAMFRQRWELKRGRVTLVRDRAQW